MSENDEIELLKIAHEAPKENLEANRSCVRQYAKAADDLMRARGMLTYTWSPEKILAEFRNAALSSNQEPSK